MQASLRKYAVELIGTFFLVFAVCFAAGPGPQYNTLLGPIGIGFTLMVVVFAGGHISGAHYNPAVSIAMYIRGRLELMDLGPYIASQFAGASLAAWLSHWYYPHSGATALHGTPMWQAFVAELIFTFLLAYVILNVATSKSHPNNSFYGLAIGGTVAAGIVAVGPISGAVFNPAVGLGVCIAQAVAWGNFWIYLLAPALGAIVASLAFLGLNPDDRGADAPAQTEEQM